MGQKLSTPPMHHLAEKEPGFDGVEPSFSSKCCLGHAMVTMKGVLEDGDDVGN